MMLSMFLLLAVTIFITQLFFCFCAKKTLDQAAAGLPGSSRQSALLGNVFYRYIFLCLRRRLCSLCIRHCFSYGYRNCSAWLGHLRCRETCTKQKKIICNVKKKHLTSDGVHAIMPEVQGKNLDTRRIRWTHCTWRCCLILTVAC